MEKTEKLLRHFKRKTKKTLSKNVFTEFFLLNKNRKIIEFLNQENVLLIELFFKQLIPTDFREFVNIKILNEFGEDIFIWYFEEEILSLVICIKWGFKKQEISVEFDIENFTEKLIEISSDEDEKSKVLENINYKILNDYIISFLSNQAENLSKCFNRTNK